MSGRVQDQPIQIEFQPALRSRGGRLRWGGGAGTQVHAGSFLRERRIVLDTELLGHPAEAGRILIHELYHFVWVRIDNATRRSWETLVSREIRTRGRGELGWSSEWRKKVLTAADRRLRTRRWREYACESFCDTAAWLFGGLRSHEEFTLPAADRRKRRSWFRHTEGLKRISL